MKKLFLALLTGGLIAATATSAHARELYFSVKGGLSHQETEIKPINAFAHTDTQDNPFGSFAIGVRSGSLRGELEYTYRAVDSEADSLTGREYEFENQSAMYNLYFETCPHCAFSPYLSVGGGATYISSRYPVEGGQEIKNHAAENKEEIVEKTSDSAELSEPEKTLAQIPGFEKEHFLNGAKRAFEIIVTAFAKGDIQTLEMLVSKNLYKKFQEILAAREAEGITSENDFIGFDEAEIISASISKNNVAKIVVKFISEQVNILKNRVGEVIEGDENFIQNITDVWTFEKNLTSASPNWLLVSTKK